MNSYRTLKSMRDEVAEFIQDNSSARSSKIDNTINQMYSLVSYRNVWIELLRAQEQSITAAAGKKFLYLPKDCGKRFLVFTGTLDRDLPGYDIVSLFRRMGASHDIQGVAHQYADAGTVGRKADFHTSAETVTLSSGAGNSGIVVIVRGLDSTGENEVAESVTLDASGDGVTTATFSDVYAVSAPGSHTVTVVATGTDSAIEYATVAPSEFTAKYKRLRLDFIPSAATTLTLYYQRTVKRLVNDNDVVDIPVSDVIVEMTKAQQYSRDKRVELFERHMATANEYLSMVLQGVEQEDEIKQATPLTGTERPYDDRFIVVSTS